MRNLLLNLLAWVLGSLAGSICLAADTQKDDLIKIDKAEAVVEYITFDPDHLPDPAPPIGPGEQAVCTYRMELSSYATYTWGPRKAGGATSVKPVKSSPPDVTAKSFDVKVNGISIKLTLKITVWLPQGVAERIKVHEEGHRKLAEIFYADADQVARRIGLKLIAQPMVSEGPDGDSAAKAAVTRLNAKLTDEYLETVNAPCAKAQEIYDDLTQHARRTTPTAEEAVKMAVEKSKKEK